MRRLCDDIFFGVYSYLLKVEGGSKNEISFYFAYSTLFALVFLQILVLAGIVLLSGGFNIEGDLKVHYGVTVAVVIFAINWLLYAKNHRYEKFVSQYFRGDKTKKKIAKSRTVWFVSFVFLQFFIIIFIKIAQFT